MKYLRSCVASAAYIDFISLIFSTRIIKNKFHTFQIQNKFNHNQSIIYYKSTSNPNIQHYLNTQIKNPTHFPSTIRIPQEIKSFSPKLLPGIRTCKKKRQTGKKRRKKKSDFGANLAEFETEKPPRPPSPHTVSNLGFE